MELNKFLFKSLIITNIILIVLLFATNIAWFIYESQFQKITETTETYTQSVENVNNTGKIMQNNN